VDGQEIDQYFKWHNSATQWAGSFPLASTEVFSAARCYLFDQPTASVFHSMRGLEIGLTVFAKAAGVAGQGRDQWEVIINNIESELKKINGPHAGTDWKRKQELYSEAALHFRYLKNAWRNHVMHSRHDYEGKKALEIGLHVSDFISELSGEMALKEPVALAWLRP
jgi:hypothetical protein